jgi:hypothetical protein
LENPEADDRNEERETGGKDADEAWSRAEVLAWVAEQLAQDRSCVVILPDKGRGVSFLLLPEVTP